MSSQISENTSATRPCTASDRPRSAKNQSVSRAAVYQPTTTVSQRCQCAAEAVLTGRMRKRSAPGARMNRSSTEVSHTTITTRSTRAIRPCSSGGQSNRRKAPSDPTANEPIQPSPNASRRPTALSRASTVSSCIAIRRWRNPVVARQKSRSTRMPRPRNIATSMRVDSTPRSAISAYRTRQARVSSGSAVGIAASEARMCWRTAIAGAVMSAEIPELCLVTGAGARACSRSPSHVRTSGSSMSESNSRTLAGGAWSEAAGCCAPAGELASASINHRAKRFRSTSRRHCEHSSPMHGLRRASGSLPALPVICTPPAGCPRRACCG